MWDTDFTINQTSCVWKVVFRWQISPNKDELTGVSLYCKIKPSDCKLKVFLSSLSRTEQTSSQNECDRWKDVDLWWSWCSLVHPPPLFPSDLSICLFVFFLLAYWRICQAFGGVDELWEVLMIQTSNLECRRVVRRPLSPVEGLGRRLLIQWHDEMTPSVTLA